MSQSFRDTVWQPSVGSEGSERINGSAYNGFVHNNVERSDTLAVP